MIAILVRESEQLNPEFDPLVKLECEKAGVPYDVPVSIVVPAGTRISRPDAWELCKHGMAIPGDKECQTACGMSDERLQDAITRAQRLASGIGFDIENGKLDFGGDDEDSDDESDGGGDE